MNKIKVLLLPQHARNTNGGGILRYCQELTKLFVNDENIDIQLIENLPYFHKFWGAVYDKHELEKVIIDSKCDIVHINGFATLGVAQAIKAAKSLGKKVVLTPHWHPFWALKHKFLGKWFFNLIIKPQLKNHVDGLITFNKEDTHFFNSLNYNVNKIPHWMMIGYDNSALRNRKKNMILFVGGRLNESNKGAEYFYRLPEGKYDIHFVGIGNVPYRNDITIHSNISDKELFDLYKQTSLVVVPSRYESFSYVTLEALSFGSPVVISDRVRIGDYLIDCPMCKIFKYGDYNDFVKSVENQISVNLPIRNYLKPFLPSEAKKKYMDLYSKIINKDIYNI